MTKTLLIAAGFLAAAVVVGPLPAESLAGLLEALHVHEDLATSMAHGILLIGSLFWAIQLVRARLASRTGTSGSCA